LEIFSTLHTDVKNILSSLHV